MGSNDITIRSNIGLIRIHQQLQNAAATSVSLTAGQSLALRVTTTPGQPNIAIWTTKMTFAVDVAGGLSHMFDTDGAGNYLYVLGTDSSLSIDNEYLTTGQQNVNIDHWYDWAQGGGDITNNLLEIIILRNNDSSSHTYYMAYKAFTLSAVGSGSGFGGGSGVGGGL